MTSEILAIFTIGPKHERLIFRTPNVKFRTFTSRSMKAPSRRFTMGQTILPHLAKTDLLTASAMASFANTEKKLGI